MKIMLESACTTTIDLLDCEGTPNGNKTVDVCGVCGGDGTTCHMNAVYIRWGREDCPTGTRILMHGVAARYGTVCNAYYCPADRICGCLI